MRDKLEMAIGALVPRLCALGTLSTLCACGDGTQIRLVPIGSGIAIVRERCEICSGSRVSE